MTADLVVANASILTMDEANPEAEALAMRGNRISAVGRWADIKGQRGKSTREIDARGASVVPGFIEAHMHLFAGAAELEHLQLFGIKGFEALRAATLAHVAKTPGDDLIIGEQADYTILSETEPVTRHHLDRIVGDRPLMIFAPDHHTAWANTRALEMAGILRGRKLGPGNEIVMAGDGLAAGELREGEAINPVRNLGTDGGRDRLGLVTGGEPEPRPSAKDFEHDLKVIQRGLAHCARNGITALHNMDGNIYTLELLAELMTRGQLTARARVPFHLKNFMDVSMLEKASRMAQAYRGEMLCSGFVKMFMDGVVDSGTAVMVDDYSDRKGWRGEPLFTQEHFNRAAIEADRRGLQIAVHAIGDGAVRSVLDGYEAAIKANGRRDSRHRIEHVEVIHPDDIRRFADLGVLASMQPPHPPGNHGLPLEPYLSRIGEERWPYAFAWNTLRAAGARLVFGTDWPVSDVSPLWALQSAIARPLWKKGLPDHRQTLRQALRSYTVEGAHAGFMEDRLGMLRPGMLADAAVLGADLEKTDPATLRNVPVAATICDGRVVYQA